MIQKETESDSLNQTKWFDQSKVLLLLNVEKS